MACPGQKMLSTGLAEVQSAQCDISEVGSGGKDDLLRHIRTPSVPAAFDFGHVIEPAPELGLCLGRPEAQIVAHAELRGADASIGKFHAMPAM